MCVCVCVCVCVCARQFRLIGELIYIAMWCYYFQKEARRVYYTSPKYAH